MAETRSGAGGLRVAIVEDDTFVGMGLTTQLQKLGHHVVGQAADAREARQLFRAQRPDLVLMDIRLAGDDGLTLAQELLSERRVPMIVVSAYSDAALIERAGAIGIYGYLVKPIDDRGLAAQIQVAVSRFAETERLRTEREKLAADLETRKLMDRAKAIMIKRAGISEEEAHRRLQQESQKRRIAMADLCRKIIDAEELMSG